MAGLICDTSIWIDFFHGEDTEKVNYLIDSISNDNPIYTCPTIIQELLQGIRNDGQFGLVKEKMAFFPCLDNHWLNASIGAADLYRRIRKRGVTIRKPNDCLIAWYAIEYNLPLLHNDKNFELIAEFSALKSLNA
ncbi:MAG: PIN domain-containing protein [Cyclobacteriaceae bacterium]